MSQPLFEPINLDGMADAEELEECARVLEILARYARIKAIATRYQALGRIVAAQCFGNVCGDIYIELPEWARW